MAALTLTKPKIKCHSVWVNLQLEHVVGHVRWKPLQEITKIANMILPFNAGTCNENHKNTKFASLLNLSKLLVIVDGSTICDLW